MGKLTPEEKEQLREMLDKQSTRTPSSVTSVPAGKRVTNFVIDVILSNIISLFVLFADPEIGSLGTLAILFLYYFAFEATYQRTPGKLVTNTKVVMLDGSKPGIGTIAIRTLIRFVPFEPISCAVGAWWHDRWSKTEVVRAKG